MKGVIVGSFTGWVEQTRGLPVCDAIIEAVKPDLTTGGAYTSVGDYPAAEFVKLAEALARREGRTAADIMREFGRDAYGALASLHPAMVEGMSDIASLLGSIETVIHTDVRKLYPDSQPPLITAEVLADGDIAVTYRSHRHLTALCHGLIEGAVAAFPAPATVILTAESQAQGACEAHFVVRRRDASEEKRERTSGDNSE